METGANIRFREIGLCLQRYGTVAVCSPKQDKAKIFDHNKKLFFIRFSRLLAALEIFIRFKLGGYDILITDLVPTIPGKNTYFMIHDLRQFTDYKRHNRYIWTLLYKTNLKLQKKFITVSNFTKTELKRFCSKKADIIISFNGVHVSKRKAVSVSKSVDFLYIATFEDRKNHSLLIDALSDVKKVIPNFSCVLLGRDLGTRHMNIKLAKQLGVEKNIVWLDTCSDKELRSLYQSSKIFVSPSLYEGFGIPLIEALSHGLPVVCSDINVFRELSNEHFYFFDPHSKEKLTKLLIKTLTDYSGPSYASNFISDNFDWDAISKKLITDLSRSFLSK